MGCATVFCLSLTGCSWWMPFNSTPKPVEVTSLFAIDDYDQDVDHWINPLSTDYDKPVLPETTQRAQFDALFARYFGTAARDPSPWNPAFINAAVYRQGGADIAALQRRRLGRYDNRMQAPQHIGYGQNLRPHSAEWIDGIAANLNVAQFEQRPGYDAMRRAIATSNVLVRGLPTSDPSFYDSRIAGEGYPFDNLQISAIRPGTPVYIVGTSSDGAWQYVQTPDVQGWVSSTDIGLVDEAFVTRWRAAAKKSLGGIIGASVPVRDASGAFRFAAPAGTMLPIAGHDAQGYDVLTPANDADGHAQIHAARLNGEQTIVPMPWPATPRHIATLLRALIGRPYGWGNTGLYNDCSSELQSVFAPLGIWLPRHSANQMTAGSKADVSALTPTERVAWLSHHGQPLRSIIYIGGHVMFYLGNTTIDGKLVPVVYQDIWGMRPVANTRRAVIGGSVIMPITLEVPEDSTLRSLAATPIFQVMTIDTAPPPGLSPESGDDPAS
jgi:SH3 domain (SH3b1 type)/NLPC_P60 stabilising domain, N term/SH3 domain of SH3b2 type/NlpC/P60 family